MNYLMVWQLESKETRMPLKNNIRLISYDKMNTRGILNSYEFQTLTAQKLPGINLG